MGPGGWRDALDQNGTLVPFWLKALSTHRVALPTPSFLEAKHKAMHAGTHCTDCSVVLHSGIAMPLYSRSAGK